MSVNALGIIANDYGSSSEDEEHEAQDGEDEDQAPKRPLSDDERTGVPKRHCGPQKNDGGSPGNTTSTLNRNSCQSNQLATRRLPPPTDIASLFPGNASPSRDDIDVDHQGRQRAFPHERGNWATYVYLQYLPNTSFEDLVDEVLSPLTSELTSGLASPVDLQPIKHLHISLSRTVVLRHHWIQPFVDSLKRRLKHIPRFCLAFDQLETYANDDESRSFLSLKAGLGSENLQQLVAAVDGALEEYNLPPFYSDPSFHMSIGWCLGNQTKALKTHLPKLQEKLENYCLDELDGKRITFAVDQVTIKSGNKVFLVPLNS